MMLVIAVIGVLLAVGIPGMRTMMQGRQLVGQATDLASAIAFTRAEATARSKNVVICSSNGAEAEDDLECSGVTDWSSGWIIFVDTNLDNDYDGGDDPDDDELLKREGAMNGSVTLNANVDALPFNFSGESLAGEIVEFDLCAGNATSGNVTDANKSRLVTVSQAGSTNITMGTAACTP